MPPRLRITATRSVAFHGLIGLDQAVQALREPIPVGREGNPHAAGIGAHPLPVALPGEHHAVVDADGREHAPAVEQSDLPGRETCAPVSRISSLWSR